jgi:hypothetical protein
MYLVLNVRLINDWAVKDMNPDMTPYNIVSVLPKNKI